jgi:hypothetical protein
MRKSDWLWLTIVLVACGLITARAVLPDERPPEGQRPHAVLSLAVELDKSVYARAERVSATVTVTNAGFMPVEDLVVECEPTEDAATTFLAEQEDQISLDVLGIGDGVVPGTLEPYIGTATGVVSPDAYNVGVLAVVCAVRASNTAHTTVVQATAAVAGASNEVTGRFTLCQNGRYDHGAVGIPLTLDSLSEDVEQELTQLSTITDADGRFTFPDVPVGPYQLSYTPPTGYRSNHPDLGNFIQLLVTGDDIRWETSELSVTTADPKTSCV